MFVAVMILGAQNSHLLHASLQSTKNCWSHFTTLANEVKKTCYYISKLQKEKQGKDHVEDIATKYYIVVQWVNASKAPNIFKCNL